MNTICYKIYFLLLAGNSLLSVASHAQLVSTSDKRIADGFYAKGDYYAAAQYYEKYLADKGNAGYQPYVVQKQASGKPTDKEEKKAALLYRVADSYWQLHDYAHAASWYKQLLEEHTDVAPVVTRLYYGICLRAAGNYAAAQQELEKFLQRYKTKDHLHQQATRELANCTYIQQQLAKQEKGLTVDRMGSPVNQQGASYAAGWMGAHTLLFTSTRPDSSSGKPVYVNAVYRTTQVQPGEVFGAVDRVPLPATGQTHQGAAAATPDGTSLFFTSWSVTAEGKKSAAIYVSEKKGDSWGIPVKMGTGINAEGYITKQPFVTPDGKYLLFVSDRPGGKGGFDIWYAPLKGTTPGKAVNAGAVINTKEDEEAPFYHAGDKILVFASNGKTGMGGFDLYTTKGDVAGNWEAPENMGYPVNSIKDDIYFTGNGAHLLENAFIGSDRASACCLEIFGIHPVKAAIPVAQQHVPEKAITPEMPQTVSAAGTTPPDTTGLYVFAVRSLYFGFNETAPDTSAYTFLDQLAAYLVLHPGWKVELGAYTDGKGETAYNLKLSEARAKACAAYLVHAGVDAGRIVSKGYGACCPLEKETTPDGKDDPDARSRNRRVEVKVIE